MRKYGKGELAKEILKGFAVGGVVVASFALPNLPQILKLFDTHNKTERYRVKRSIRRLMRERLISSKKVGDEEVMEITEKGKKKILRYKFDDMEINRPKRWDKKWRLVMFDIPERHKQSRDAIASKMRDIGMVQIQKSIYLSPFECRDEIEFITSFYNVWRYIQYLVVESLTDNEKYYREVFDLG